ncbi:hypothetical protein C9374_012389 [Naegleria lovaniensis]|uniref:DH domain-containing protein n=1 Tax=Naegleria lovaniensis TaxID=51637 RepID=A0AA88KQB0_NAELO|nr:uncharacterized protein C9374_012389 [Naegleria lovaniensis]KAG2392137.1 hypothetical protein C9374_012389 [Naegleria lovaniensis]
MFIFLLSVLLVLLGGFFFKLAVAHSKSSSTTTTNTTTTSPSTPLIKKEKSTLTSGTFENTTTSETTPVDSKNRRDSLDLSLVMPSKEEFRQVFKNVSSMFLKNISEQVSKMDKMLNLAQSGQHLSSKIISETSSSKFDKVYQLAEEEQTLTEIKHGDEHDDEDDESTAVICLSPSIEDEEMESDEEDKSSSSSATTKQTPLSEESKKEKMNEKRKNILAEILSTEEYYVKGLLILDFIYKRQIEQKKIVDPKVLKIIFQDVDIVCNVNSKFLEELRKIYEKEKNLEREREREQQTKSSNMKATSNSGMNSNYYSSLGELLNTYAHTFKLYANYISGYKKASAALSEEKKKNKQLSKFLDGMKLLLKEQGERITQLESFLVTPVQRIPRYRLLLEDLLKNTPEDDLTKPKLKEALELIKSIALYVNEAEMKVENIQVTSHMVHKLKLKGFIKPSRYLFDYWAEENNNTIQCRSKSSPSRVHNCEVYVFSDILVFHKNFDSFLGAKLELLHTRKGAKQKNKLVVKEVQIISSSNTIRDSGNALEVTVKFMYENHSSKEIKLLPKNVEEKTRLENALRKSISVSTNTNTQGFSLGKNVKQ